MAYFSIEEKIKVIKKRIGTSDNGNPIYRDIVEVYCSKCEDKFQLDTLNLKIEFKENIALNLKCPNCNEFIE